MKRVKMALLTSALLAATVTLTGCEGDTGDTYNVTAGGDAQIGDSTITYGAEENQDVKDGIYRQDYNQEQCEEAGYFYCTIENQCLDIPLEGGSCDG